MFNMLLLARRGCCGGAPGGGRQGDRLSREEQGARLLAFDFAFGDGGSCGEQRDWRHSSSSDEKQGFLEQVGRRSHVLMRARVAESGWVSWMWQVRGYGRRVVGCVCVSADPGTPHRITESPERPSRESKRREGTAM
jgi:hypothetical protein